MAQKKEEEFHNPIDKDKIAENPHSLPYAHTVGGVTIKPIDKGKVKGQAVAAMYEQTDMQLKQIKEQIDLLASQAKSIQKRVAISENIYLAEMNFKPLMGHTYHLYQKNSGDFVLSMVGPDEWGKTKPYEFVATVKLMADHTWDILAEA
ncbi:MAG: DUF2452 domain-containing protein [Saprospiraceae bacterium]